MEWVMEALRTHAITSIRLATCDGGDTLGPPNLGALSRTRHCLKTIHPCIHGDLRYQRFQSISSGHLPFSDFRGREGWGGGHYYSDNGSEGTMKGTLVYNAAPYIIYQTTQTVS